MTNIVTPTRSTTAAALALLLCVVALVAQPAAQRPSADEAYSLVTQAYLYAYPLVLMEQTYQAAPGRRTNQFVHAQVYPGPDARTVVRPNVDTLYSTAWLDLSREPVVMNVPDIGDRYYLVQFLDAWTETFFVPGTRTTGNRAGAFTIAGPDWTGTAPPGTTLVRAPTNLVWIIGRIQTNGAADYPAVRALQRGFQLAPLSGATPSQASSTGAAGALAGGAAAGRQTPPAQVAQMDAATFFTAFAEALKANPPHDDDASFVARFKSIGIVPGQAFDRTAIAPDLMQALDRAVRSAQPQLSRRDATIRNGWSYLNTIGRYGTAYLDRASIARGGLGALPAEDAIYPSVARDADGRAFAGSSRYIMHFAKDGLPPVNAFWSLTMYDADGYFAPNAISRYAVGDRDALRFNADGSLDLYIQHERPGDAQIANWLPSPEGDFNLTMRLYWPKPAALSGSWTPPVVRRVP